MTDNILICRLAETDYSISQVYSLIQESFRERFEQGLLFTILGMSLEDYTKKTEDGIVLIAEDIKEHKLVGTITFHERKGIEGNEYAYMEYVAVIPEYKRCGVASLILHSFENTIRARECMYILSDTSCKAVSSIKWHERNGLKKIGCASFSSTNYYSFVFKKRLDGRQDNELVRALLLLFSIIKTKLLWKASGDHTILGRMYHNIKDSLCKK